MGAGLQKVAKDALAELVKARDTRSWWGMEDVPSCWERL